MSKHTPGPWIATPYKAEGDTPMFYVAEKGKACPIVFAYLHRPHTGTIEANAALIAAAPDLLAACETVEAELNRAIRSKVLGETWTGLQLCLADAIRAAGRFPLTVAEARGE
jgi:hypothetical protein